ncbi:undecaprenyl-diphosphatase [Lachnoclostridium sp. An298]|uniref:undecaprenyl-diphosphate phosphatase n=1 Tax=Mediterraneibacter glycyrrhizinilyticus TaxID=342942 RepID=UPI000B39EE59|nr:undecaprenyl-diphosphate phosphatase [Mediterraneibacter glycyrrhizinilyticus]MDN0044844.1 undecaprenyl-diphosphate phosphatase [Mediterraneibacter glycyrrhizinilyticus]OUO25779.1 undecaprenyl-diphosphatase [Lachnoclostridium sp. An298]
MLDILKAIIFGIVEGITEWLPISSTGHIILMEELLKLDQGEAFFEMFQVVIQLGAILAVVVIYFHKLNPFSPTKTQKQKMMTWQIWIKVIIGCLPAGVIGLLFDNWIDKTLYHWYVVALMLIVYGVLFIVVENYQKGKEPRVTKFSQLTIPMILIIGVFQMLAMIPGTSRSGATIVGALMIGVSRSLAAEYTFFLAIPVMFGASLLKLVKFGFNFTTIQLAVLLVGMVVSFAVSIVAIKFLMSYIRKNDFKVFGYYRIVLGVIVFLFFGIQTLLA